LLSACPRFSPGAVEAVLSQWMIQEGQEVAVGDTWLRLKPKKPTSTTRLRNRARLARILIKPGDTVEVGAPIAVFAAAGDTDCRH
jgi:pyruvate dehydrogenase E2 component (dihydrolipoamide acetyltransferase)